MSWFGVGPNSIESTTIGVQATLSTATLLAEVDLNGTNASAYGAPQAWGVTWILSAQSTGATFLCDHARSTGVGSTAIISQTVASVSSQASGQYFTKHVVDPNETGLQGHRFRVRVASSVASAAAKIIAEPLL